MKKWCRTLAAAALFITVCTSSGSGGAVPAEQAHSADGVQLSAWVVYWDSENGFKELEQSGVYDSVSYFAAYFNDKGKLFLPDAFDGDKTNQTGLCYLTIVNDVAGKKDGSAKFKDVDIVKKVLKNDKVQQAHADEIIRLAKKMGCGGIDLDYERVFRDDKAAKLYLEFIDILYEKAQAENLKLRVILEPNVDFGAYKFPRGPQYVVMFYNLYGTHSGEGPKADFAFIRKTADKMKALPGTPGAALAAGGCLWSSEGEKKFISSEQAQSLARRYRQSPERALKSNALYFSYKDEKGIEYAVWYADELTLMSWINKVQDAGIDDICIWRLGGNDTAYSFGR